jgi:hypothetical protein
MNGIDPIADLREIAGAMNTLQSRADIEAALDRVEYVIEVLDPEWQDAAYTLHEQLQARLRQAGSQ